MRKLLVAVLALGIMAAMKAPSFAFVGVSTNTFSGGITFNVAGTVNMSVAWNTGSSMAFSGVTPGVTQWAVASNYLVMSSTMTDATGGIEIFTNNRNGTAPYKFTGSTYAVSAAGLINGSNSSQAPLPMCWRATTYVSGVSTYTFSIVQGPDFMGQGGQGLYEANLGGVASHFACYLWMLDWTDPTFTPGESYALIKSALNGYQMAEATWFTAGPNINIYLGADFANAFTPTSGVTYQTTTLTINSFHQ